MTVNGHYEFWQTRRDGRETNEVAGWLGCRRAISPALIIVHLVTAVIDI